ncbi:hypothetical protein F4815DRAFT_487542 [Daldinia loculata]|nr:hypothetical protein F4815DRAFT_487542 [Daldinia loculata]
MASPVSSIAELAPEILLEIFKRLAKDNNATLVPSILCCRKWRPLALSVLYDDVVLNQQRLVKFVENCADHEIRSLTLRMGAIPVNPYDTAEAKQTAEVRLEALRRLCSRITRLKPTVVSILVDFPFPYTGSSEISSIINNLPASCISLEIDIRYGSVIHNFALGSQPHSHLCDSIRDTLPRLQHLRLRLPRICPDIFSVQSPSQGAHRQTSRAAELKTCLINLSLRLPGTLSRGVWATLCSDDIAQTPYAGLLTRLPSALPSVLPVLKDFACLNSVNLERLWAIDVQPRDLTLPHSWSAWVRRDFISNASFPIHVLNIGGFKPDGWLARVPLSTSPEKTQDWVSSPDVLEMLAEDSTWIETTTGARLPMAMLREDQDTREALTRIPFYERNLITCMLWINEDETGEKLLPEGPGELMQQWDLNEITPSGWTRDAHTGSPMVRA